MQQGDFTRRYIGTCLFKLYLTKPVYNQILSSHVFVFLFAQTVLFVSLQTDLFKTPLRVNYSNGFIVSNKTFIRTPKCARGSSLCILIYILYTAIWEYVVSSRPGKTCSGPHSKAGTKLSTIVDFTCKTKRFSHPLFKRYFCLSSVVFLLRNNFIFCLSR